MEVDDRHGRLKVTSGFCCEQKDSGCKGTINWQWKELRGHKYGKCLLLSPFTMKATTL